MHAHHLLGLLPVVGLFQGSPRASGAGDERFLGGPGDGHAVVAGFGPLGAVQERWYLGGGQDGFGLAVLVQTSTTARHGWYAGSGGDGYASALCAVFDLGAWSRWFVGGAGDGYMGDGIAGLPNPLDRDTDGDDLPDWWELPHFGGLTNAAPGGDRDRDGVVEYDEYVALTDPNDGLSYFRITYLAKSNGIVYLTVPCSEYRVYDLLSGTNLTDTIPWLAVGNRTNLPGQGSGYMTLDSEPAGPAGYYRVRVRIP
jgi:hypothetical protein